MAGPDQASELLQTALDHQLDTFFLFDHRSGRALRWNRAFRQVSGYTDEEIAAQPAPASYYSAEDLGRAGDFMERVLAEGTGTIELALICKDGRRVPTEYKVAVLRDARGEPEALISIGRDMTERRELEGRLAMILQGVDNSLNGFDIVGDDLEFRYCNQAYAKMWGYGSPEEIVGRSAISHAADPQQFLRIIDTLRREGRFVGEFLGRRRDGETFDVQVFARSDSDEHGRNIIVTTSLDVTERRGAERALRESERRTATLMKNLPGAAYRCRNEPGWPMEFMSEGVERITGLPPSTFVGEGRRPFSDAIHPEDRDMVWRAVQDGLESDGAFEVEYRIVDAAGEIRWVSEQGRMGPSERGEAKELEGYITDITKIRALESQLQQAQKMEAVGRLAGGVAHDFNNLLTVIQNSCDLMLDDVGLRSRMRRDLEAVQDAAERAAKLTRQLLAFSRKQLIRPHPVDVHRRLSEARGMLEPLLGEDVVLHVRAQATPCIAWFDPGQLDQILLNLAVNARDAMPRGGRLLLQTQGPGPGPNLSGSFLRLIVEDDGEGMSEATLRKVFEPFFTTKELGKGTGLGLSTVYGIVKQHGGSIEVTSTPGEGTRFVLYLPTLDPRTEDGSEHDSGPALAPVPMSEPHHDRQGDETILVVEDEPSVREVTRRILTGLGYEVLTAESAEDAIETAREASTTIDLVLSDVVMAGRSGVDCVRELTRLQPGLRALLMSGHPRDTLAPRGALESEVPLVQKPFSAEMLARAVRAALDRPRSE